MLQLKNNIILIIKKNLQKQDKPLMLLQLKNNMIKNIKKLEIFVMQMMLNIK